MKKSILLLLVIAFAATANAQNKWNIGLQLAALGNHSKFSGGMSDANALFSKTPYGAGQIGFYARKTISNRFSLQTGFDFTSIGFSYMIAQDYSLLKNDELHGYLLRTGTCMSRIPVSLIYNSKLNCRNVRFIAGIGLAVGFIDNKWEDENVKTVENGELGNSISSVMKTEVHSTNSVSSSFTTLIGVEKVYSRGNMLSLTLQGNCGFKSIAESTVNYTVENKNYNHTFRNNGSYGGLAITYYFRPVGSKKAGKNLPAVVK